jgi:hypothetical protein
MKKPMKIFFYGIACAALIAFAGYTNTFRLESNLRELELKCVGQGRLDDKVVDLERLHCDSESILNSFVRPNAIQAKIVQTQHNILSSKEWPYHFAFSVFLVFALPLLWYLLRSMRDFIFAVVRE